MEESKNELKIANISKLISLQDIIFNLTDDNVETSAQSTIELFIHDCFPNSIKQEICGMIYSYFDIQMKDPNIYFRYMLSIDEKIKGNKIFKIFSDYILSYQQTKSNFLLDSMLNHNLVDSSLIKNRSKLYFAHYYDDYYIKFNLSFSYEFSDNFFELSNDKWKLHKEYVRQGINPSKLLQTIRYDEIEKLQEITSQTNFNFNQNIKPSLYEICKYINRTNVSLIDYAAFFGSVKCFKYLLMNGSNIKNTLRYAVAGGNEEIIHLCEKNHSSLEGVYEAAIQFHQNDIFHYLYDNEIKKIENLEKLGLKCIFHHNYEIFSFLLEQGMNINDSIVNVSALFGNLYLINQFNKFPNGILSFATYSGNLELVKFLLSKKSFNCDSDKDLINILGNNLKKIVVTIENENFNVYNDSEETAFIIASIRGLIDIAKYFIERKRIDVNTINRKGRTILFIATKKNQIEIVKLLLEQEGIDVNAKNKIYFNNSMLQYNIWKLFKIFNTALMKASFNGHTEIVKLLLRHKGIDVNAKDNLYFVDIILQNDIWIFIFLFKSALMKAITRFNTPIVELLLVQEGIDIYYDNIFLICLRFNLKTRYFNKNFHNPVKDGLQSVDMKIRMLFKEGIPPFFKGVSNP